MTVVLDVCNGGKGVLLGARRLAAATVRELSSNPGESPFAFARRFCQTLCPAPRLPGRPIYGGNAGFPDLPGLAAEMSEMGVRPGIWIGPLLLADDVPQSWRVGLGHPHFGKSGAFLDPSVPEVLARVQTDVARLSAWGYGMIKHDFTTYDITGR